MLKLATFIIASLATLSTIANTAVDSIAGYNHLCEGDLLFVASAEGNAITSVTTGFDALKIDHVAIVHRQSNEVYALEAIGKGVMLTPIDTFMLRATPVADSQLQSCSEQCSVANNKPLVIVGRLADTTDVSKSVARAMLYLGRPYDYFFMSTDSAIYCSELVQLSYLDKNGRQIFDPIPMSFHDASGQITKFWIDYYGKHGLTVPEGEPGTNPGELSRRPEINIIYRYF